jgi:DNA-binding beta-propeller fold protein YncE
MKQHIFVHKVACAAACALLFPLFAITASPQTVIATIPAQNGVYGVPMTIAVNPFTQLFYIVENGVEVLDQRTNQPVTTFSVGQDELLASAINPLTRKLYVADFNTGVYIIDLTSNTIVGQFPMQFVRGMTYNPINNLIYAMDNYENVWVVDGRSGALVKEIAAPANTEAGYGITVNPATNMLYVPLTAPPGETNSMYVVNAITNATTIVPLQGSPGFVAVDPLRNIVYISEALSQGGQVEVMNGATNTDRAVITSIPALPENFSINPLTRRIYLSDANGNVYVIDGTTNTLTSTVIPVGTNPINETLDLLHGLLYVGNTSLYQPGTPSVSVISLR